jgi:hypothetical protein
MVKHLTRHHCHHSLFRTLSFLGQTDGQNVRFIAHTLAQLQNSNIKTVGLFEIKSYVNETFQIDRLSKISDETTGTLMFLARIFLPAM